MTSTKDLLNKKTKLKEQVSALKKKCDEIEKKCDEIDAELQSRTKQSIKIIYGVEWIESEFGQRPEGYLLFLDLKDCINKTIEASRKGPYKDGGGYLGPVRPLYYVEIPFDSLDEDLKTQLVENGTTFTPNRWEPKFSSKHKYI